MSSEDRRRRNEITNLPIIPHLHRDLGYEVEDLNLLKLKEDPTVLLWGADPERHDSVKGQWIALRPTDVLKLEDWA